MSVLELSKEMLAIESYIADAKLILEKQVGKHADSSITAHLLVEIAKMIQVERQTNLHKKPSPVKKTQETGKDQVMSTARANPQVPLMVSSPSEEVIKPKRSHSKKVPVADVVSSARVRKDKLKVEKAKPAAKTSRRR